VSDLVGAEHYFKRTDQWNKLNVRFTKALSVFNKQEDLSYDYYVARKHT
jgi:hypothetical protein